MNKILATHQIMIKIKLLNYVDKYDKEDNKEDDEEDDERLRNIKTFIKAIKKILD